MVGRADLHTHTKYSGMSKLRFLRFPDAVSEPLEVVQSAERRGLDIVCITDHDTIKGAEKAAKENSTVEVVVGEEVSTSDGEIIGLFLTEAVPRDLTAEDTIDCIHSLGGVAIAPHPFSAHCNSVAGKLADLDLDGVELFNAFHRDGYANDIAQRKCESLPFAKTGGSDAHAPMMVGDGYTTFEGATGEELRRTILSRKTSFDGRYTTFRDFVWLTTLMTLNLQRTLLSSLMGAGMPDDSSCSREIFNARAVTRLVGLAGTMVFLMPPVTLAAGIIADKLHSSRSRLKWKELVEPCTAPY
ncbi:MAG: PHP domain-containing protein [Methanobacteriota archaeon]|nr:MAG: PHP domain-containing protein [Euryarchaeota archaeon]